MIDPQEVEGILDRFREWLSAARIEGGRLDRLGVGPGSEGDEPQAEVGIIDLVEEFTALRHELKLQTKSGRGLLEQTETLLAALRQAIEQFRSVESREGQAAWAAGKPLAEALADLDEALDRGRREIEKARYRIAEESIAALVANLDDRFRRQSWIRRLQVWGYHQQILEVVRDAGQTRRELFDSLLEGYGLIQNRLHRVMKAERVDRIPCEGHPVDPERMTVIEVVEDPSLAPGTVVKELRSGYTWKGRVLRYAEVQAVSAYRQTSPAAGGTADAGSRSEDDGDLGYENGGVDGENGIDFARETDVNAGAGRPTSD
jgi:molecular chaperone GrpE